MVTFKPVTIEDKEIFDFYLKQKYYEGSEYTFTNFYIWRNILSIEWALVDELLYVKATDLDKEKPYILPPLGINNEENMEKSLLKVKDYFLKAGFPFTIRAITQEIKELMESLFSGQLIFTEERELFDYVYLVDDLVNLKGRRYHRKRNHIKNFKKLYSNYQLLPLTEDLITACIENLKEWCEKRDCKKDPSLLCEQEAIIEALEKFSQLDYIGAVMLVDDKIEGFTLGEKLNKDTVVIHAEKGNVDLKGIYPTINQEFLKMYWSEMTYVNREEDLGREGLRKAKMSYYPFKLVVKYKGEYVG